MPDEENKKSEKGLLTKLAALSAMRKNLLQLHNQNPDISEELHAKSDAFKKSLDKAAESGNKQELDNIYKTINAELKSEKWKPILNLEKTNKEVAKQIASSMSKQGKTTRTVYKLGLSILSLNNVLTLLDSTNTNLLSERNKEKYAAKNPDVLATQKLAQQFCVLSTLCDKDQVKARYMRCQDVIDEKERKSALSAPKSDEAKRRQEEREAYRQATLSHSTPAAKENTSTTTLSIVTLIQDVKGIPAVKGPEETESPNKLRK